MSTATAAKRVAVFGGGVAGMTAAHELAERGFQVTVYEQRAVPGGKARSLDVPNSAAGQQRALPGEHGFRFFPGFYRHVPDTMKRIPYGSGTVLDNLVNTTEIQIARAGKTEAFIPAHFPATPGDLYTQFEFFFGSELGLPAREIRHYIERLLILLTTCEERRFKEYEYIDWWTFVGAEQRSDAYQKFCADGVTRSCVACRAREMSTRTGGYILLQLLFDLSRPGAQADRVLNGPTNVAWIEPWLAHLRSRGVDYRTNVRLQRIHCAEGRLTGATVQRDDGTEEMVAADYYVSALPVEVLQELITEEMKQADPVLAKLQQGWLDGKLRAAWMNGILFYLANDVRLVEGHSLFIDSQWSLTSVSQQQFWPSFKLEQCGDGKVCGSLSVDISDWDTPGLGGRSARQCTNAGEIKEEVWNQLKASLNDDSSAEIEDGNLVTWFLDDDIRFPNPSGVPVNLEPLLINTVASWDYRPEAVTRIPNLFLAGDYVRTHTDLATMEAANESARRAVNGILAAAGSKERRCAVWPLAEPWIFAPLRALDLRRFRRGLPHNPSIIRFATVFFVPLWHAVHLGWDLFRLFQWLLGAFTEPMPKPVLLQKNPRRVKKSPGKRAPSSGSRSK
jgi:15-cis-phytoene desaturase